MQVAEEPLPFEELFVPTVLTARQKLIEQVGSEILRLLLPNALDGWERYLLSRLAWLSAHSANWQFGVYKTVAQAFPHGSAERAAQNNSLYRAFVNEPVERLRLLFEEFPGLVKMQEFLIADWLSATQEFLTRLSEDRNELAFRLEKGSSPGPISAVHVGLSDPHLGGRTVAQLILGDAPGPFYKPRSVAAEHHFAALVQLINSSGTPYALRAAKCWNRTTYGWMENISHKPCANLSGVRSFYWRAGALMCMVYVAKGVDIHRQNIIADGEFPILVDLETLWHPQDHVSNALASEIPSVLRTGFIPGTKSAEVVALECSALSRRCTETQPCWVWTNVNTDEMEWALTSKHLGLSTHIPRIGEVSFPASNFVNQIQAGFRWVSEWALNDGRRDFESWITQLGKCPLRRVKRSSVEYLPVLEHLRSSISLRKGSALDSLSKSIRMLHYSEDEMSALRRIDIPHLVQHIRPVKAALHDLTAEDLLRQEQIIATSLRTERSELETVRN